MAAFVVVGALLPSACRSKPQKSDVFLWAGERAEDLRFLEPGRFGIAYFAGRAILSGGSVDVQPSREPIYLPLSGTLHAVVRIDPIDATLTESLAQQAAAGILKLTGKEFVTGLQIHFDASPEQRTFYRQLLTHLRAGMQKDHVLAIAAKTSWCGEDPWIEGLPIDEAIPLLFESPPVANSFPVAVCNRSAGLSIDAPRSTSAPRRYYRSPRAWDAAAVASLAP